MKLIIGIVRTAEKGNNMGQVLGTHSRITGRWKISKGRFNRPVIMIEVG